MGNNYTMIAKTLFGFEDILAEELGKLGAMNVKKGVRSVFFEGDEGFMYKANLCLRTALRILKPLKSFNVKNEGELYNAVYNMPWERYMTPAHTFAVDAVLTPGVFSHSRYVALKVKDAVADRFRTTEGHRPNVNVEQPDVPIHVHVQGNNVTVALDSSGQSLHRRGYRTATNNAPVNEVLAAGMLLLSGWNGQTDFLDPMCGSGTIVIEAAMIACNIPPGIYRKSFAFQKWPGFDSGLFDVIRQSSLKKTREFHHHIYGCDKAPSAVQKATDNVRNARLENYINIRQQDFFTSGKPVAGKLHILFNPPYGERLSIDPEQFYTRIGNTLKQRYPQTEAWFITATSEALKYVGL
ncbi:MAG: class I SAM-dependent RNA methyltransferase, partial [Sinomicrobium sp.]|nr:class I SAM-dependent RNA methyltransferase [Sinomicrobium sp.]